MIAYARSATLSILLLLHISASNAESCSSIVDLSQTYFDEAGNFNANEDSTKLLDLIQTQATEDQVYSYLVLENGKKIAEYYNDLLNVTADTFKDVYSINKSWTGLLFGIMIDQGYTSLDQKVGDIWTYPDHEVWSLVDDEAPEVKDITVDQLLSMTSGFDDTSMSELDFANVGGKDLAGVLNYAIHTGQQNEGTFNYLGFANILGYVVKEATGKTPSQYAQEHIFPFLGMKKGTYDWARNTDKVSYTRNGLSITATHMAKWAQLYLQNGKDSPLFEGNMVSKEWIDISKAKNVRVNPDGFLYKALMGGTPDNGKDLWYGKMLLAFKDGKFCGFGAGGNFMCFWPEKCRVAAIQMNLFSETGAEANSKLAHKFLALVAGKDVSEADYLPKDEVDPLRGGVSDPADDSIESIDRTLTVQSYADAILNTLEESDRYSWRPDVGLKRAVFDELGIEAGTGTEENDADYQKALDGLIKNGKVAVTDQGKITLDVDSVAATDQDRDDAEEDVDGATDSTSKPTDDKGETLTVQSYADAILNTLEESDRYSWRPDVGLKRAVFDELGIEAGTGTEENDADYQKALDRLIKNGKVAVTDQGKITLDVDSVAATDQDRDDAEEDVDGATDSTSKPTDDKGEAKLRQMLIIRRTLVGTNQLLKI